MQSLYNQLTKKYPNILFGYKETPEMAMSISAWNRKRKIVKRDILAVGLPLQEYANAYKQLIRDMYAEEA